MANSTPAQSRRTSTRRNGIKCTPARRRTAETSGQKVANSMPAQLRRPSTRRSGMKNARRLGDHRQRPAGKRWQNSTPAASKRPNRRRNGMKMHAG
ncbi:hypothetical protein [Bianquea renquensis]|uniref:Uncharacterized protein n=1 Tax=Bianquea renquensis TaxID=2763661 RepID=A0A926DWA2_9FIRM|nr:hypothetical protein [Bianquea renquensis]MBC8545053.1 hypothetical protein [Bianquea renquensis]